MPITSIRGKQIVDGSVQRADLDTTTVGQAITTKVIQGANITLSSTGADAGTGDVTVSAPVATATTAGVVPTPPNNTTTHLRGDATFSDFATDIQPTIWSARLRSYNAIGNPSFEVDQRNVFAVVTNPTAGTFIQDRWIKSGGGTYQVNFNTLATGSGAVVPGTNFRISSKNLNITLTTQESVLAAGDFLSMRQLIEGPGLRELISDVHSFSILASSSVVPLKFGIALRDAAATPSRTLTKLCTIATTGWNLITLPNLPVWDAGGTFNIIPGQLGYDLSIVLACGSTNMSPANDTWQSGNFVGAVGQDNFCSKPVNSVFQVLFIQHEPGPLCTTLIDCQWQQAYDSALRYYQKSYDYDVAVGTVASGFVSLWQQTTAAFMGPVRFHKPLAKVPTMTGYNNITGAVNSIGMAGTAYAISSFSSPGKAGFAQLLTGTLPAVTAGAAGLMHYTADTGW